MVAPATIADVLWAIRGYPEAPTVREIRDRTGLSDGTVRAAVKALLAAGRIVQANNQRHGKTYMVAPHTDRSEP